MKLILVTLLFISRVAFSQDKAVNADLAPEESSDSSYTFHYSPFSLMGFPLSGKKVQFEINSESNYIAEYAFSSLGVLGTLIDVGSINQSSISFSKMYYFGKSFFLTAGLTRNEVKVTVGDEILTQVTGTATHSDLLTLVSYGTSFSAGNKWKVSKSWIISADWASAYIPLSSDVEENLSKDLPEGDEKDLVEEAASVMGWLPNLSILSFKVGYEF